MKLGKIQWRPSHKLSISEVGRFDQYCTIENQPNWKVERQHTHIVLSWLAFPRLWWSTETIRWKDVENSGRSFLLFERSNSYTGHLQLSHIMVMINSHHHHHHHSTSSSSSWSSSPSWCDIMLKLEDSYSGAPTGLAVMDLIFTQVVIIIILIMIIIFIVICLGEKS